MQKNTENAINLIPGIVLCLIIALPSWRMGKILPTIGGPVFAIIIGIAVATIFPAILSYNFPRWLRLEPGTKYTSKKLLQYSIILLGFDMNMYNVIKVGGQSLIVMLFTFAAAFITAFLVGKLFQLPGNTTILIGVGTSVCGGSAIAATAPVIGAKDSDVARAISTIFLFNIVAVFLFPPIGRAMGMTDIGFGMWAGTAINDTSSVVAAATVWSESAGSNVVLQFATIVKLTRTLMIVPITLALAIYTTKNKNSGGNFNFVKVFPWFVFLFMAAAIVNTFAGIPESVSKLLVMFSKFLITMALAAIGLNTSLKTLFSNGIKPIALGLCCWLSLAVVSIIVQSILNF